MAKDDSGSGSRLVHKMKRRIRKLEHELGQKTMEVEALEKSLSRMGESYRELKAEPHATAMKDLRELEEKLKDRLERQSCPYEWAIHMYGRGALAGYDELTRRFIKRVLRKHFEEPGGYHDGWEEETYGYVAGVCGPT